MFLTNGYVNSFFWLYPFYEHVFAKYKILAYVIAGHEAVSQKDGLLWTSFFTKSAEYTAKHIDLVYSGIFLLPVEIFFPFFTLRSDHGDGFCRTSYGAQPARGAVLPTLLVAF